MNKTNDCADTKSDEIATPAKVEKIDGFARCIGPMTTVRAECQIDSQPILPCGLQWRGDKTTEFQKWICWVIVHFKRKKKNKKYPYTS